MSKLKRYTIRAFRRDSTGRYLLKQLEIDVNALERAATVRWKRDEDQHNLPTWHQNRLSSALTCLRNDDPGGALAALLEAWSEVRMAIP